MATMTKTARGPQIRQTQCFIGGQWVPAASGKTFETINPATEEVIAEVAEGDAADVDLAVKAAREAFDNGPWSQDGRPRPRPADEQAGRPDRGRSRRAGRARNARQRQADPRSSQAADLPLAIDCLRYYAGWADKIHGQTIPDPRQLLLLHAARAGGRGRADHSLEFPDADGRPGSGARRWPPAARS